MTQWYYQTDDGPCGPLSDYEMRRLARSGELAPGTLVARDGCEEWTPAFDVTAFQFPATVLRPLSQEPAPAPVAMQQQDERPPAAGAPHVPCAGPLEEAAYAGPDLPPAARRLPPRATGDGETEQPAPERVAPLVGKAPSVTEESGEKRGSTPGQADEAATPPGGSLPEGGSPASEAAVLDLASECATSLAQTAQGQPGPPSHPAMPPVAVPYRHLVVWLVAVAAVVSVLFVFTRGCERAQDELQVEPGRSRTDRLELAGRVLGRYLALKLPGRRALLVGDPPDTTRFDQAAEDAVSRGLRAGFADHIVLAASAYPRFPPELKTLRDPERTLEQTPPLQNWFYPERLDELIEAYPECDLIVSLVGMPKNFARMKVWQEPPEERPAFAVALGPIEELGDAIRLGAIAAALDFGPSPDEAYPFLAEDEAEEFRACCRLLTPQNVAKFLGRRAGRGSR